MACGSCGKNVVQRVERISTTQVNTRRRVVSTQRLGSRKLIQQSIHTRPANDLEKHRV